MEINLIGEGAEVKFNLSYSFFDRLKLLLFNIPIVFNTKKVIWKKNDREVEEWS